MGRDKPYGTSRSILGFYRIRDASGTRFSFKPLDRLSEAYDLRKYRKSQKRTKRGKR